MNILVVGGGGREHALVWKLAQSPRVTKLWCAPGNAGIGELATCVPIAVTDIAGLQRFAEENAVDLTVVGPEAPLALGLADRFRQRKLAVFGPTQQAARIESSKSFAKDLMLRQRIPTADARIFDRVDDALAHLERCAFPIVIKADGLAQGKGVVVAGTAREARDAVVNMLERRAFGDAGARVVIEEHLRGDELTVMAFTDGSTVLPMAAAQDHKRIGEGETGPNTGGMGAYAPAPLCTPALLDEMVRDVLAPAIEGLSRAGSPFCGILYAGIMVTDGRPRVLEFNARFGDPETQAVLPLLKTDLADVLQAAAEHRLDQVTLEWADRVAVCVVLSSGGYPDSYHKGFPITGLPDAAQDDVAVFHAGTARRDGATVTDGGRVLGVTAWAASFNAARARAYDAAGRIEFEGRYCRPDIAARVLT